ncbi:hypothetical protein [Caballeronia sp. AZ1_KS37]|uniref:hypothetical protein n=1 Tax=Caballeronia sp. AZ1_KS37 TaxID=2921756 RepID=UPI0020278887|nr:hypothetical protein [Caballeronia sp. AZ1_KS37]
MASETQKEATTKARPQKVSKASAPATPEPVDLNTLHRDIEDRSHAIYKERNLYVIAAFHPDVEEHVHPTIFAGVTVLPGGQRELMLSNGERVVFDQVQ